MILALHFHTTLYFTTSLSFFNLWWTLPSGTQGFFYLIIAFGCCHSRWLSSLHRKGLTFCFILLSQIKVWFSTDNLLFFALRMQWNWIDRLERIHDCTLNGITDRDRILGIDIFLEIGLPDLLRKVLHHRNIILLTKANNWTIIPSFLVQLSSSLKVSTTTASATPMS